MISQFFILSARGDTIINRDFRQDLVKNTPEIFFRNVKLHIDDAPPIFNLDGVSYAHLKKDTGLFLVATTRSNMSPSYLIELLNKIFKIIKDFCGVLTEESIRKNFILIYEIIDELIDFGYPQYTSTDLIKPHIVSEASLVKVLEQNQGPSVGHFGKLGLDFLKKQTTSSISSLRPVSKTGSNKATNEIFVDIFEKLSILCNSSGYIINSSIDGYIQMKSYLAGNPELRMALNEDLIVGRQEAMAGRLVLDDCNFNECVDTKAFGSSKVLRIKPPEGEFVAMSYRTTSEYQPPFRLFPYIDEISNYKIMLDLRIKACFPKEITAVNMLIKIPMPKNISNVTPEIAKDAASTQMAEYKTRENIVEWQVKTCKGNQELVLRTKINLPTNANTQTAKKEVGPISMTFEITNYNVSGLQLKYLKVDEFKNVKVQRWVRYVTQASSYVCRTS